MTFKKARKIMNILYIAILAVCIIGLMTGEKFMFPVFISLIGLVGALFYITATYFKCPHCGTGFSPKRFPMNATHCPYCGEKLE